MFVPFALIDSKISPRAMELSLRTMQHNCDIQQFKQNYLEMQKILRKWIPAGNYSITFASSVIRLPYDLIMTPSELSRNPQTVRR